MSMVLKLLADDVKKPSALVHFEREMSPVEQKVMTLIIFHCQVMENDEKGFYYIKKSFVREFLGWEDSNNYPRIYDAFKKIYDNSIKWNFLETDRTFKSLRCRLIVSLLEPNETRSYIGYKLHPDLEPVIKDPKVFAKIKLIMMSILAKPKYAFSLYEILSDFYCRGEKIVQMPLKTLYESLGIKEDAYDEFVPFKKRVLKPNIEAINKNTDCKVGYSTYRQGRRVGGITFKIEKQSWQPPLLMNHFNELKRYHQKSYNTLPIDLEEIFSLEKEAFITSVARFHVTESDARQAVEAYGLEGAKEIRDYVISEIERRKGTKDQVRDVGAYMARCLREGYGKKTLEERKQSEAEKIDRGHKRKEEEAKKQTMEEVERIKSDFWSYQTKLVDEELSRMCPEDRADFDERFMKTNQLWGSRYRESGLETPLARSAFYNFAVKELLKDTQKDIIFFAKQINTSREVLHLLGSM